MRKYTYAVAEDEDLLRDSLIKKIQNLSLPLELCGAVDNGQDALELISCTCPDLLLLDIMMPIMDGIEVARNVHELYPNIKIVIITGYSDFELAQKSIRYGVSDYLLKPVDLQELNQTMTRLTRQMDTDWQIKEKEVRNNYMLRQIAVAGNQKETSKKETADLLEQYFRENFHEDINLKELSSRIGFAQDHLTKIFIKYKNESPIRFLIRLRIEEAKKILLEKPELGIGKVGELVGYADQYYFSRLFKEKTGMYPSEFRKTEAGSVNHD